MGDIPWGSHFCHFYETKQDLLEILVPYFKAGLENNEFCLWVVAGPLAGAEATQTLRQAVPELEQHLAKRSLQMLVIGQEAAEALRKVIPDLERHLNQGSIEIIPHDQWYLKDGVFEPLRAINGWKAKLKEALARGYAGMRVHGNVGWLTESDWESFLAYEGKVDQVLAGQKMLVLCTYPLSPRKAGEIFDVAQVHEFALARRHGKWQALETPELKQTKNELAALRKQLEQRVEERTRELAGSNEKLQAEIFDHQWTESLLEGQRRVLEMVAADAPLGQCLDVLLRFIEAHAPGILASILLLDDQGVHLRHGSAPSLPSEYLAAIDGWAIGPEAGSCGTAAFCKEDVFVEDIAKDPRWKGYRALALPHGLRACWSTPIFDAQRRVLGTFAMYYRQPALPERDHLRLIKIASDLAAISICRERVQAALRQSEAKLKEAQRLAKIGYWERDLVTDRITWSDETQRIFGRPLPGDVLTQAALQEVIHREDRERQQHAFNEALRGGRLYDVEYRIVLPSGELRFVHVRDEFDRDVSGRLVRMFGTVQDITERKRAEALLHAQEEEIRAIVEHSPDLIVRFDRELRRTYVNPAFIKACGVPKEELLGREIASAAKDGAVKATAEEVALLERSLQQVFDTGRPLDFESPWPMPSGRRTFAAHLEPEFDAQGALASILCISRDITERKQAEEALRQSQQLLQLVLDTLPVGVAVTNRAGRIVLTNAASKRIWGDKIIVSGRERWAQSKGFWHDSGERIAAANWASVRALSKGQTSLNELIDIETFDGRRKTIRNSAAPIRNVEGRIVGAVIVNEDVSERVRAEEVLRQAQAELAQVGRLTMMGELTASIAHEINQPLVGVVTNGAAGLAWLAAKPPDLGEARKALMRIARDGKRASEVIARIRALLKKGEPIRASLDINDVLRETIALMQPELSRKRVILRRELALGLPRVAADRVQLQQVMLNLVNNAAEALETVNDGRRVLRIRTDRPQSHVVRVQMRDTGVRVDPDQAKRLFDPFFTTKPNGLGLGLAISRSIVEAHGGRMSATPNRGRGMTFQFTLPVQNGGT